MRWALLLTAAACVPSRAVPLEIPEEAASVLVVIDEVDKPRRFIAETGEELRSGGVPLSAGDGELTVLFFRYTLDELLLEAGAVQFAQEGSPLPRAIAAERVTIQDRRVERMPAEIPSSDELLVPFERWFSRCFAAGNCGSEVEPGHFVCRPCDVLRPELPAPPAPPIAPEAELARDCLGPSEMVGDVPVCTAAPRESCSAGEIDLVGDDRGCLPVGTPCDEGPVDLPIDAVHVPADAASISEALAMLGSSRTIALAEGDHVSAEPLTEVVLIGRCASGTRLMLSPASLREVRFENLELEGSISDAAAITASQVVLSATMTMPVDGLTIESSLVTAPLAASGSLSIASSVLAPQLARFGFSGGTLDFDGVRIEGGLDTSIADSTVSLKRVATEAGIWVTGSTITAEQLSLGALRVRDSVLDASGIVIDGTAANGVLVDSSSVAIDRLVVRNRAATNSSVQVIDRSFARIDGALFEGSHHAGLAVDTDATAILSNAWIRMEAPLPPYEDTVGLNISAGALLIGERIAIRTDGMSARCGAVGQASLRLSHLDCEASGPTGGFLITQGRRTLVERARFANFTNAIWSYDSDLEVRDFDVACAAGREDLQSGGLQSVFGTLRGERIAIAGCPENGLATTDVESVAITDLSVIDSYSGVSLERTTGSLERVAIMGARFQGISIDNGYDNEPLISEDTSSLSHLTIVTAPNAVVALDALRTEGEIRLEHFSLSAGLKGIDLDTNVPTMIDGTISNARIGIEVSPLLFPNALGVIEGIRFLDVASPIAQDDL